jgi:CRISPR-associated protein Cas1
VSRRGIFIGEPARLSVKQSKLVISRDGEDDASLPFEDLAFLVLDTQRTSLSGAVLSACACAGCLLVTCDDRHLPCGALLPSNQYYRQWETARDQIALSLPRKKNLWREIVRHKIRNQAACLRNMGHAPEQARKVAALALKVRSGDPDNVEAHAARLYWNAYAEDFTRDATGEDRINAMLNYGYALIRAGIARELAALGFITCLGLKHGSMENAFNLADDILEPWRPFVDRTAMRRFRAAPGKEFTRCDRQALCGIFHEQVLFAEGEQHLVAAVRQQVSMIKAWTRGRRDVAFPDFPVGMRTGE